MSGADEAFARGLAARASDPSARTTRRGQVLGGTYRLLDLVGAGGMAEVYAAEHTRLGRRFAVKLLRAAESAKKAARFRREASAIASIDNDFVVGAIDCGEAPDGMPYLVMELLQGEDLRSLLERASPLPIPRAVHLVWEACQGIRAVHRAGLVHRDLKPENLYVQKRSTGQDWCIVLDFGLAKSDLSNSTAEGAVIGTVKYMAPEQLQDGASAGLSVDIYALGAVLYECLSGVPPHSGPTVHEVMFKIINEEPKRLRERRPEIPMALADAVERALARSPGHRFDDIEQFARAIAPFSRVSASADRHARSDTLELEEGDDRPSRSVPYKALLIWAAISVSGIAGFSAGSLAVSRKPETAASRSAPASFSRIQDPDTPRTQQAAVLPSAANVVEPPSAQPVAPSPAPTSTPARLQPPKLRAPVSSPHLRLDSENPYAR